MEPSWGLLGPEFLPSSRRVRTLGLGSSVRLFNDLAVPGLGGVWYGKQLLLASLGVLVAEQARSTGAKVQNIEAANSIEAIACWLAFNGNGWAGDPRLRGSTKLSGKRSEDLSFSKVRQRNFYVTQPMRMTTVQTLPALGFVDSESSRFSAFRCSSAGRDFIEEACQGYHPFNRTVVDHLGFWVSGQENRVNSDKLRDALSPLAPLKDKAIPLLRERLLQGGRESSEDKLRRRNALAWVEKIRTTKPNQLTWDMRPEEITKSHWHDLKVGALFFRAREAAITVLDALEAHIGNQATGQSYSLKQNIPEPIQPLLMDLKTKAKAFIDAQHHDRDANTFCVECNATEEDVLRSLVNRDRQVLRTVGDEIKPGPAFLGTGFTPENLSDDIPEDSSNATGIILPRDISYRMRNLYLLNLDMHGELNQWLNPPDSEAKT